MRFLLLAVLAGNIPNINPTIVDVPKASKKVDNDTLALNGKNDEIPIAVPKPNK